MDLKKLAERYLSLYPEKDMVYGTPDGNFFLNKSDAANHARASRFNYFEFERGKDGSDQGKSGSQEEMTLQLTAEGVTIDPETGDYNAMLRILHGLNLKPESRKKADVIAAFKNWKDSLPSAEAPAGDKPAEDLPAGDIPAGEAPAGDKPAEDSTDNQA